jgi:putative copper export protein/mono/diheme cytochrome c family protein
MTPDFDLQGGVLLAAVRAASVAALLSAFGTVVFRNFVVGRALAGAAPEDAAACYRRLLVVAQQSALAGVLACLVWLVVQAGDLADVGGIGGALAAVPLVVLSTSFGHVLAGQVVALLVLVAVLGRAGDRWRPWLALIPATAVLVLQAGHSHAASMYDGPSVLLGCDILHLLGAGAWLGGLLPLWVVVRGSPPGVGAAAARWFSPLGQVCIAALIVSAAVQGWVLVASVPGLVGTAYGWLVLVKSGLFVVLLGFAAANRYRFAPALGHEKSDAARARLVRSLALQTAAGLAMVVAAAVLSDLPPAMHGQALWPFRQRFSLDTVHEDPDFLREVLAAAGALGAALVLVLAAFVWRRFRWASAGVAAVVAWFSVPHFSLLLVDAYPTSFYRSPTGFSAEAIVDGGALFAGNCVACHGARGAGDGVAAKGLAVPPADLTAAHLWMHSDGELFWWLSHGIRSPEGAVAMPGFAGALDEDQRWDLIDYIRANNAGVAFQADGEWPHSVQAPSFAAQCGERTMQLSDMRGRFVRLVIGRVAAGQAAADVVTVAAGEGTEPAGVCVAQDEKVVAAYGIVTGGAVPSGSQFLIDADGVLRAMQMPGVAMGWDDPKRLAQEIADLRAHKIAPPQDADPMGGMDMKNMKM